jgi:hypothetical protein
MRLIIRGRVPGFLESDPNKLMADQNATMVIDVPDQQCTWIPDDPGVRLVWGRGIPGEITGVEAASSPPPEVTD